MRFTAVIACVLFAIISFAQRPVTDSIKAKVYELENVRKYQGSSKFTPGIVFDGPSAVLASQSMLLGTLQPKGNINLFANDLAREKFFIVKKGSVTFTLNNETKTMGRGSVVVLLPGDGMKIENNSKEAVEYYEMVYQSGKPADMERAKAAGPSFMMDWKDMVFKAHDKGGVRQLFDRKTAMLNRFDIHVTQLNEGNKSHDPHQHKNEEIILMLEGNAEMQIGTDHQKANPGDVVFLTSNVLHNLTNVGKVACLYFAIQWN